MAKAAKPALVDEQRQGIERHRTFLKEQDTRDGNSTSRYYKGPPIPRTREACPGCGDAPDWKHVWRLRDGVCLNCRKLMQDGLAVREKELEVVRTAKKLFRLYVYGYYEGSYRQYPQEAQPFRNWRDALEDAMRALIVAVSEKANSDIYDWNISHGAPCLPSKESRGYGSEPSKELRLIDPVLYDAIDRLDRIIRASIKDTSDVAREKGTGLLLGLASGEMTLDEFNKASLPEFNTLEELQALGRAGEKRKEKWLKRRK